MFKQLVGFIATVRATSLAIFLGALTPTIAVDVSKNFGDFNLFLATVLATVAAAGVLVMIYGFSSVLLGIPSRTVASLLAATVAVITLAVSGFGLLNPELTQQNIWRDGFWVSAGVFILTSVSMPALDEYANYLH